MPDGGLVDGEEAERLNVVNPHRVGVVFKQQSVALLGFAQRLLRPLALGDVAEKPDAPIELILVALDRRAVTVKSPSVIQ